MTILAVIAILTHMIYPQQNRVYAQTTTASVSIVPGSSSLSISKPYDPSPLTVKVGTSVTWTNKDSTIHTVTSGLPEEGDVGTLFDSSLISPGMTFVHVFDKTGMVCARISWLRPILLKGMSPDCIASIYAVLDTSSSYSIYMCRHIASIYAILTNLSCIQTVYNNVLRLQFCLQTVLQIVFVWKSFHNCQKIPRKMPYNRPEKCSWKVVE
jgi:plastocyanin